ncbi:MAG: ATP-binding protein [Acetobacteraceae bacterium]|jgi:two-component system cell cycle sensor histidine kinase/response regulator CckA|nr:ATP-binding protein [Acetobacteraceae bacterium]
MAEPARPASGSRLGALAAGDGAAWRRVFDEAAYGIAVVDGTGRIVAANTALAALAGADPSSLTPGSGLADLIHPQDRRLLDAELARLAAMPAGRTGLELRLGGAAGQEAAEEATQTVAMVSVSPLVEDDGTIGGAVVRFIDITRHRALETQLAQTQKMQAVGQLAGGIAHDFNNLLTAIIAAADMSLERVGADEATRADLVHVRRSAERGAALVRQLLAFGRKQTLQPRVIALNAAIEDVASLLRRLLGQRITIALDLDSPGSLVRVDPVQFDQVIVNLALNARDAMPRGGRLTIRTGAVTLYRPLVRGQEVIPPGRYAMVEVADTGSGIAPEHLGRLFEPFFTTKRDSGGTGLGLAMVYGIVRQTDGFIAVESVVGEGTTFRIYIPRHEGATLPDPPEESVSARLAAAAPRPAPAAAACAPAPLAVDPAEPAQGRGTILLVEDEEPVRRLTARGLSLSGWTVLTADSGEAALAVLAEQAEPPAALISDVSMPGMDGPALVRAVRAMQPDLPVILVSGYADTDPLTDLPGAPVQFLPKPFSIKDLAARLEALPR